jgi:hypothetical protein
LLNTPILPPVRRAAAPDARNRRSRFSCSGIGISLNDRSRAGRENAIVFNRPVFGTMALIESPTMRRLAGATASDRASGNARPVDWNDWLFDGPDCLWREGRPLITCGTCPDSEPTVIRLNCQRPDESSAHRPRVRDCEHLLVQCPDCGRELARKLDAG